MDHCVDILPHLKCVGWVRIWRTPRTPSSFLSSPKCDVDVALLAPLESLLLGGQVLGWEGNHTCVAWSHRTITLGPSTKTLPFITADVNKLFRGQWVIFDSTVPQYSHWHCIENVRYFYSRCVRLCFSRASDWGGRKIRFARLLSVETPLRHI